MERFDVDGLFWLVDKPDDRVAGRLRFDPAEGAKLDLIGKFKDFVPSGSNPPVQMNAVAGGRFLTLEDCHFTKVRVEYAGAGQSGLTRHEYQSDLLFAGLHREDLKPLEFKNVLLHLRYLEQWVRGQTSRPIGYEDRVDAVPRISHQFDVFERATVVDVGYGELGLSHGQVQYGDQFLEMVRRQNLYFDLRLMESRPFGNIVDWCWMLQDLVTLGCDHPSAVTGVVFEHAQQHAADAADTEIQAIRPYMRARVRHISGPYDDMSIGNALFTFDDIAGMEGVTRWLEVATRFRIARYFITNNLYSPMPYSENSFVNSCTAAEAIRRIQVGRQNLKLSVALQELAEQAGDVFTVLVTDVKKWAKKVVQIRANSVIHPGLQGTDGVASRVLGESLHLLVVLCLLEECGVRERASKRVQDSVRAWRLKRSLPAVL